MRGERPYSFTNMKTRMGMDLIASFIEQRGGLA